jgi:hypothetical protein
VSCCGDSPQILGKLITLPALQLVWWRMLLVAVALACFPRVWRALRGIPPRLAAIYAGIGVRGGDPLADVLRLGEARPTLRSAPPAWRWLRRSPRSSSPAITGARFERHNLLLGILVIPGVTLVVGGIPAPCIWILGGCLSAILAAVYIRAEQALPGPSRCDGRHLARAWCGFPA